MKRYTPLFLFLFALIALGCDRSEEPEFQTVLQAYQEENEANKVFDGINKIVEDEMDENKDSLARHSGVYETQGSYCSCSQLTFDKPSKTLTLDFGTNGCLCRDGRKRQGKLIIRYTDRYRTPGAVITTTTENYKVNDKLVQGTKTVTNQTQPGGKPTFRVVVSGPDSSEMARITDTDKQVIQWKSTRIRTMVEGDTTRWKPGAWPSFVTDDVYSIYGKAEGIGKDGTEWTAEVTAGDPLYYKIACWFDTSVPSGESVTFSPIGGSLTLTPKDGEALVIDYGENTCDREATVTYKGRESKVILAR